MLEGGCFCGAVRYVAEGEPFNPTLCHCADCRRAAGAPCVAWFSVPAAALRFTRGAPRFFASSPKAERGFCAGCGTTLTWRGHATPGEIDVTIASLDDPEAVPPADHTLVRGRLSWMRLDDGLPQHQGWRTEE